MGNSSVFFPHEPSWIERLDGMPRSGIPAPWKETKATFLFDIIAGEFTPPRVALSRLPTFKPLMSNSRIYIIYPLA